MERIVRGIIRGALAASALAAAGQPAQAQQRSTISGVVHSSVTQAPLRGARVTLSPRGGKDTTAVTDSAGKFVFDRLARGRYVIQAWYLDQSSYPATYDLADREVLEVEFRVGPVVAVELPEVTAEAEGKDRVARRSGFERRAAEGSGQYLTRADIRLRDAVSVADLVRPLKGIRVVCGRYSTLCIPTFQRAPTGCYPRFYLDGVNVDASLAVSTPPSAIEGIEAYSGMSTVPLEFVRDPLQAKCGVIVIWTRLGRDSERFPPES